MPAKRRTSTTARRTSASSREIPNFFDRLEWRNAGPYRGGRVAAVAGDPRDRNTFYFGSTGGGVWKTMDGGQYWENTTDRFFKRASVGAIAVAQADPNVIYVGMGESCIRGNVSHGDGVYRSTDAGQTWTHLGLEDTRNIGKVRVHPEDPDTVYVAALGHAHGPNTSRGVFRSRDGGETWERGSEDRNLRQRAWYYHHIYAHPTDPETVWVLNVSAWLSNDGGKTFQELSIPHGDHHDLWIDPKDPNRIINGNDGGAVVTLNGGESWSSVYNQPTAEFYHVITDTQTPYRIYGAQQDNTTMTVPSRSAIAGITAADSFAVGGGEAGYIAIRADDPNVVFAGNYQGLLTRYDRRTGQARNIMVWPETSAGEGAGALKYRMQWTAPTVHSPHDPNVLYHCGNHVFRSTDEGTTWERISPDLTRNDKSKLGPSGGPITKDNTGAEYYCTVFAFAESPVERGVLWAGSDDGLLHVSRDDGKTWKNVTPAAIRPFSLVSIIEPSPHDAGTAYVATTRYKHDDFRPYLWKTTNYGRTWTKITNGIRGDDFTRVIREDPTRKGLLYAGTETGVYVSFDDGARWNRLGGNLPVVPIHDMVVKDSDLVLGTHGRSFWVLDDLSAIRQLAAEAVRGKARLFTPRPTVRVRTDMGFPQPPKLGKNYRMTGATIVTYRQVEKPTGEKAQVNIDSGQNPPDGVLVSYWLRNKPEGDVTLTFMDAKGKQIRQFKSAPPEPKEKEEKTLTPEQRRSEELKKSKEPKVAKEAGLNRFAWNMRHPDAARVEDDPTWESAEATLAGPVSAPGQYRVRLEVGGERHEAAFEIRKDPRVSATQADLDAQFALRMCIRDKLTEVHEAINGIRALRTQVEGWEKRAEGSAGARVRRGASSLKTKIAAVEEELIQVKAKSRQDTLNYPAKLNLKIGGLAMSVGGADFAPTKAMYDVFDDLSKRAETQLTKWRAIAKTDVPAFDKLVRGSGVPAVSAVREKKREARTELRRAAAH